MTNSLPPQEWCVHRQPPCKNPYIYESSYLIMWGSQENLRGGSWIFFRTLKGEGVQTSVFSLFLTTKYRLQTCWIWVYFLQLLKFSWSPLPILNDRFLHTHKDENKKCHIIALILCFIGETGWKKDTETRVVCDAKMSGRQDDESWEGVRSRINGCSWVKSPVRLLYICHFVFFVYV